MMEWNLKIKISFKMLLEIIRLKSVVVDYWFNLRLSDFFIDSIRVIYSHKNRNDDNLKIDGTK